MTQIAKWTALGALFIIPFLPLYVASELFFPFITGKGFAFRILVEIAFASWIFLALTDERYRPKFSWAFALFAIFTLWMLIADLLGVNPHKAIWSNFERMDGWMMLIHLFMFSVAASSVLSVHNLWKRWWLTFISISAIVVGHGLLQAIGALQTFQGNRVEASFGNAAYLPGYLIFALGVTVWQAIERKGWLRYTLLILATLQALVILLSATRGAFLGLVGGVVVGAGLWFFLAKKEAQKVVIGTLVGVLVLVGGLFALKDTALVTENLVLSRLASSFNVESLDVRFSIWNMALQGAYERPITGWGQEGFNYVFAKHYDPALFEQEPWFDRAHNVFLDWLTAGGFPALLLFLSILGFLVYNIYKGPFSRIEKVALIGTLTAYGVQGLAVFDNLFTYVPLVAILAMVHSHTSKPLPFITIKDEAGKMAGGTGALILAVVLIFTINIQNIQAGTELIKGLRPQQNVEDNAAYFAQALSRDTFAKQEIREHLSSFAVSTVRNQSIPEATRREVATLAITEMQKEIERVPNDPRIKLQFAALLASVNSYQEALVQMEQALALSPNKQSTYIQVGGILWQAGNAEGALQAFEKAYELDPSFDTTAGYVAAGAYLAGNPERAEEVLTSHFGTLIVDSEVLRIALYETGRYDQLIEIEKLRVEKAGNSPESRFLLALLYANIGRIAEAEATVQAVIKDYPEAASQGAQVLQQIRSVTQ